MSDTILNLSSLSPASGSRKVRKRKGIGEGSGNGKTGGRGGKGQTARSGSGRFRGFEGGQMPMHRRLPKRGFTSRKKVLGENVFSLLSIATLNSLGIEGDITVDTLVSNGIVKGRNLKVKLLGGAVASARYVVEVHAASASAIAAIKDAGGEVRIIKQ